MNRELTFFIIDGKRAKLIGALSGIIDIAPRNPEEIPTKLQEIQREIAEKEPVLFEKVRILLTKLKSEVEGISPLYKEGFDKCINIFEKASQSSDLKEVLNCLEDHLQFLNSLLRDLCSGTRGDLPLCSELRELLEKYGSFFQDIYEYSELRFAEKTLSNVNDFVFKEGFKEEYVSLIELAKIYGRCLGLEWFNLPDVINRYISNKRADVFSILSRLRNLIGIGEADLVKAYLYLMKLIKRPYTEGVPLNCSIRKEVILSGVEPALAYVLAHVAERIDLDELAKELEVYVKLELADLHTSTKEKVYSLYLNLAKIVSLPLCLASKEVDWRLAIALGLSAARYWSRWNDVSSFTGLCSGLMALSQYVSKEEAERVLVYATLFRDFDFIIELEPLLRAHHSLRSLASYL